MRDSTSHVCALVELLALLVTCCILIPRPVASADGGAPDLAYVAGTPSGVSVIDVQRRAVSRTLHVGGNPQDILLALDGSRLYVTQPVQGRLAGINAQSGATVCTAAVPFHPSTLTQTPSGDMLFVGSGAVVRAIDPQTCRVRHLFRVDGTVVGLTTSFFPGAFVGHVGTYQVWVAAGRTLVVFDTAGRMLLRFSVPTAPHDLLVPPQSAFLYFSTSVGAVMAFDIGTRTFTAPLLTGGTFGPMDYNDTTGEIFILDRTHRQIDVLTPLDPERRALRHAPQSFMHVGATPVSVAIASGGQWGCVALQDGRVVLLDIPGRRVVALLHVGGSPHSVIIGSYPPPVQNTVSGRAGGSSSSLLGRWRLLALVVGGALLSLGVAGAAAGVFRYRQRKASRKASIDGSG